MFNEDEDENHGKEATSTTKDATPVMTSIIKEEQHNRNLVQKSKEIIAQMNPDLRDEDDKGEDLRDVLLKRRRERKSERNDEDLRDALMREKETEKNL